MVPRLLIVRGLPGSGKSTFGETFAKDYGYSPPRAADDFFMLEGEYRFDPSKLSQAHEACQAAVKADLQTYGSAVVCNTFSQGWEIYPYVRITEEVDGVYTVVDLFDGKLTDEELAERNVHGVPLPTIRAHRAQWEADWERADFRPPWERK
jgi:hypothetical protein